ncbi:MAG: ATP-binding cassette domain-containing protein, partial [Caldilineaceae bacterium]|nr:ATP-binding cassette domain-containing protein [Caldilineaceae bacterium]
MSENGKVKSQDPIIVCRDVHKWYGDFHVLRGINMDVKPGEVIVICGPSGSGKSTFIRCMNRLEEHQQGDIVIDGIELTHDLRNINEIRREVGMVFQQFNLFPHLTVLDNVRVALQRQLGVSYHFWRSDRILGRLDERALELLDTVGLRDLADTVTVELPYGRKRALEIATTLAMDPKMMLL